MKAWSAALTVEIAGWAEVKTRAFFGFSAFYRGERIFALLPRTRAMGTPDSIAFKLESPTTRVRKLLEADPRIGSTEMQAARWHTFALAEDAHLRDALEWLGQAYEAAGRHKSGT